MNHWLTYALRAAQLFLAAVAVLEPQWANGVIAQVWSWLCGFELVHHRMFEAGVATASFAVSIGLFKVADAIPSLARYRFVQQPLPPWRLNDALQRWFAGVVYLAAIYLFHCFKTKAPLDPTPPSARALFVDVLFGVVMYDSTEFVLHMSLHRIGPLKSLHKRHHSQTRLTAPETLNHGMLDAMQQVCVNIFVQGLSLTGGRKHVFARLLHNVIVTYMLTEIHSGYDAPWSMHNVWPWVCGGAKRHEVHHRDGSVYYAEFFSVLDDLFGTTPSQHKSRSGLTARDAAKAARAAPERVDTATGRAPPHRASASVCRASASLPAAVAA